MIVEVLSGALNIKTNISLQKVGCISKEEADPWYD